MKKLLFTFAFVSFIVLGTQAQLKYGIRAGANLSSLSGDGDEALKSVTGFYVGPTIEATIPIIGLGVDASVLYSQKGFKGTTGSEKKTDYIEVPVSLKYKLGLPIIGKLATPFIDAGPYATFKVSGKSPSDASALLDQWKTKSFGAGLNFGLGVELFGKLQVRGGYQLGLTDSYKEGISGVGFKDRTWRVGAAALF
ncbi:porin family protein [Viscerimonas tarda]